MKPALLVIDIQNEFLKHMPEMDKTLAFEYINGAIMLFRQKKLPIIRIYHTEPGWGPEPGSNGFEFPESVKIVPEDPKVVKNHPSAFKETDLLKVLRELESDTLFLSGLSATGCVLSTYHGASDRDFNVFMLKDALISPHSHHTRFIEEIHESVTFKTMHFMLEKMSA